MNIWKESFCENDIEEYGRGAGVLPFSVGPDGVVRVLLGRERFMPAWRGSCRWSGFEGSRSPDESVQATAIREFMEESMGIVLDRASVTRAITERAYASRIVLKIVNDRQERYHCTYVLQIPWDMTLPDKFHRIRYEVECVDRLMQEWTHYRPVLLDGLDAVGPIEPLPDEKDGETTVRITGISGSVVIVPPWHCPEGGENGGMVESVLTGQAAGEVSLWDKIRRRMDAAIVPHECVTVTRDSTYSLIQHVDINYDYLEKDQIRWWTLAELRQVIANKGYLGAHRFRPYFLPVLQTFLQEVEQACDQSSEVLSSSEVPSPSDTPEMSPSSSVPPPFPSSSGPADPPLVP